MQPQNPRSEILISYFRSGWAFLIPYLAAYLLYAWLKWPVNPSTSVDGLVKGISESGNVVGSRWSIIPRLLHVYWFLHGLNLIIGVTALRVWWRNTQHATLNSQSPSPRPVAWQRLYAILPWLCLALIFWIPGVYLEWPSDPWDHLRRINEWHLHALVTDHSTWLKSSYFIPYSILCWATGLKQIFWLDFYYTGICLLLCWQYYRLARACGLEERAAMVFVLLQALLQGNSIFSFYRYYGISSSIFSQLGAIALTRIALEAAKCSKLSLRAFFRSPFSGHYSATTVYLMALSSALLLPFIGFNHQQGLGITALGIGAVIIWRLVEWKRTALWGLIAAALIANVLFLSFYPRPAISETYRALGYLNSWYGFNLLNLSSPAGERMLQVISALGLVNLAAAFLLLRRNHVIAWLTILPFVLLLLAWVAVPLAHALSNHEGDWNIVTFQRMLFSTPPCLALVCFVAQPRNGLPRLIQSYFARFTPTKTATGLKLTQTATWRTLCPWYSLVSATLVALTVLPSSSTYNRTWNTLAVAPNDLQLRDVFLKYDDVRHYLQDSPESQIIATQAGAALFSSYNIDLIGPSPSRKISPTAATSVDKALDFLCFEDEKQIQPIHRAEPNQQTGYAQGVNLIPDPNASNPSAWITLGGHPPEFVSGIDDLASSSTALQNPIGESSEVFTSALISIQAFKSYRLEMKVKQPRNVGSTAYLAVAWYDTDSRFLESHIASPQGAGNPRGWSTGTYSYFGLVSQIPQTEWSTFRISFGLGEAASIPHGARFVRVGALLNYNTKASGLVQLTDVKLSTKATPKIGVAIPPATSTYSPASQAALLSAHWLPQQNMVDRAGTNEIHAAAAIIESNSSD